MFFRNDCPKFVLLASLALFLAGCDTDDDGLPDAWESMYDLDPNDNGDIDNGGTDVNNGPDGDPDSDGYDNLAEYIAGSYPNNAASTPDDIDGDGFTNAAENDAGSNPNNALSTPDDIDGDGFTNAAENDAGSNPNNALSTPDDIDGDGFTNAAENDAGSDPNLAASTPDDIDGDGFTNAAENDAGSDPNLAASTPDDIDGDGFTNAAENDAGSDPNLAASTPDDIDGDGFTNAAENDAGSNPSLAASTPDDIDGDGFTNAAEMMAGSDPNLATSTPDDIDGDGFTNAAENDAGSDPNLAASTPNDIDGDGFTNAAENDAGSDPNLAASTPDDIDGDGFTNAAENDAGSDPNLAASTPDDIDGDGFTNAAENDAGSNPNLAASTPDDIDGDGFTNAAENDAGSDPNLAASTPDDIDGDGFTNAAENDAGSDPNLAASTPDDIDGDGLPDAWESMYGLDPNDNGDIDNGGTDVNNGPDGDPDSDGFDNMAEYIAGSYPNFAASTPNDIDGDGVANAADTNPRLFDRTLIVANDIDDTASVNAGDAGFTLSGVAARDDLGYSVSGAGDVNGDGIDDVIVGAIGVSSTRSDRSSARSPTPEPPQLVTDTGAAYVIYGTDDDSHMDIALATDALAAEDGFRILGAATGDELGWSVSGAGDVNGDGIDDVIVGARGVNSFTGAVYVIYGTNDRDKKRGDIEVADFSASDYYYSNDGFRILGAAAGDELGNSVSAAGDTNGDGMDDLIVGAYQADSDDGTLSNTGAAYVIYGQTGNTRGNIDVADFSSDNSNGFRILGAAADDDLGRSVSGAGDIDGDGIDDLIVGAPGFNDFTGVAYVIYGYGNDDEGNTRGNIDVGDTTNPWSPSRFSASVGFTINGAVWGDQFGFSVSSAGDVNGDGIDDVIVGARSNDDGGNSAGAAYVIYGQNSPIRGNIDVGDTTGDAPTFPASAGFTLSGAAAHDNLGYSVSSAGDVNGDGIDDLIVGARYNDDGGYRAGAAYVIYGKTGNTHGGLNISSLSASTGFRLLGVAEFDELGNSVSGAGDVNGDGTDDVIVGAYGVSTDTGAAYVLLSPPEVPESPASSN